MARANRIITTWLLAMGSFTPGARATSAADREPLTVVLHVTDFAHVDSSSLQRARAEVNRIFAHIAVRVIWTDIADGPQARGCEGANLFVSLLSPFLTSEHLKRGVTDSALGSTQTGSGHAFIYVTQVGVLADKRGVDEGMLLGRVIAHEVGHLLMPGRPHSAGGLMTTGIDTDPVGMQAQFLWDQSEWIRVQVKSRTAAQNRPPSACGSTTTAAKD